MAHPKSGLAFAATTEDERGRREKGVKRKKKSKGGTGKSKEQSITEAAGAGAVAGSVVPGIGTIIGAGVGAATAGFAANKAEKDASSGGASRPKRRRVQKAQDIQQAGKRRREQALATLSQAVFDFGSAAR